MDSKFPADNHGHTISANAFGCENAWVTRAAPFCTELYDYISGNVFKLHTAKLVAMRSGTVSLQRGAKNFPSPRGRASEIALNPD